MLLIKCLVLFFCLLGFVNCYHAPLFLSCKMADRECIKRSAKTFFPTFMKGIPSLGVKASDPLYYPEIFGRTPKMEFKFVNSTITGVRNCEVDDIELDLKEYSFHLDMSCKNINFNGKYFLKGEIFSRKIDEQGNFDIFSYNYKVGFNCKVDQVKNCINGTHLVLKDMIWYANAEEQVIFELENLTNGCKDLEELLNTNWKKTAVIVHEPVIDINMKKMLKNVNKFLEKNSVDELFLD